MAGLGLGAWLGSLLKKLQTPAMTWRWTANRRPPHRISSPPHARLQTQAPRTTPQPKPHTPQSKLCLRI
ncbi:hypothetical protein Hanom_Chr07g00636381 [Helianthus anomalus]